MFKKLLPVLFIMLLFSVATVAAQSGGGFSIDWFNLTGGGSSSGGQFDLDGSVSIFGGGSATGGGYVLDSGLYPLGSSLPTAVDMAGRDTVSSLSIPLLIGLITLLLLSGIAVRQMVWRTAE